MKTLFCLILALLLTGCAPAETVPLTGSLSVHYLYGGALVQCNGEALLIDCGTGITPEALENYGVTDLSAIVLTGCEEEQTAALAEVLPAFPAPVYGPGGQDVTVPEDGQTISLDCARLEVLSVPDCDCLALMVTFGEDTFLFLGSMAAEAQNALAQEIPPVQVLQTDDCAVATEALLIAASPAYLMVDGSSEQIPAGAYEIFDTHSFGPVTLETEGSGITASWSLFASDSVASVSKSPVITRN